VKKFLLFLFLLSLDVAVLRADEQVRAVQEQLKNQGFYYGDVDGEFGTETGAAISRYQIRNGLKVTGNVSAETLASLKIGGKAPDAIHPAGSPQSTQHVQPAAPAPADRNINQSDRDFLRKQANSTTPATPSPSAPPDVEQPRQHEPEIVSPTVAPPVEITSQPSQLSFQYAALFRRTPYENAPIEVQQNILKSAQWRLLREQFYNGAIDGIPGPSTDRAITFFQESARLPRTGRLDADTLRELHLSPNGRPVAAEPFFAPDYPGPQRVYRGIWVH
jgi:peptidoglycan hydrolase-like protein with peptidoglycan-binding domain